MSIETQLYDGKLVHLTAMDHEKDPQVESRWTHDLSLMRTLSTRPALPLSVAQVKKKYDAIEKEADESRRLFHFMIHSKEDDRLLGFVRLEWIEWTHGSAYIKIAIGDPAEREKGYGSDALQLILHYAFRELNLYRLSAVVGGDNEPALRFFKRFGFVEEVRRRQAILRDGQAWDMVHLGLLQEEWLAGQAGAG